MLFSQHNLDGVTHGNEVPAKYRLVTGSAIGSSLEVCSHKSLFDGLAGRERIHRWWMPAESIEEGSRMGAILSGKPNVSFRKIVNTQLPEGRTIGVNAQQYAVLVMDVPDLSKERMK